MKKTIAAALALLLCVGILLGGCAASNGKSPDQYKEIRWIAYDYSFCINPADNCRGYYTFNDVKYNIKVSFDSSRLTAVDTATDKELFSADWLFEKTDDGAEMLYVYNMMFNTADYEDFKTNYAEFVSLKQEKI